RCADGHAGRRRRACGRPCDSSALGGEPVSISFLFALRRRWPLLVFLPLITAIVVAALPSHKTPPKYRATEVVAVKSQSGSFAQVQQDVYLVRQPAVARRAAEELGSSAPPLDLA